MSIDGASTWIKVLRNKSLKWYSIFISPSCDFNFGWLFWIIYCAVMLRNVQVDDHILLVPGV